MHGRNDGRHVVFYRYSLISIDTLPVSMSTFWITIDIDSMSYKPCCRLSTKYHQFDNQWFVPLVFLSADRTPKAVRTSQTIRVLESQSSGNAWIYPRIFGKLCWGSTNNPKFLRERLNLGRFRWRCFDEQAFFMFECLSTCIDWGQ